jgi:TldD protein
MITTVDADFLALPLEKVSEAALSTATGAGASHADVRIERTRTGLLSLRDAKPETQSDETNFGIGVRVIVNGAWGFASSPDVSVESAQKLALTAVAMAKTSKPLSTDEISLVPEPVYAKKSWVSAYEIDPFSVTDADKKDRLADLAQSCLQPRVLITQVHIRCM